MGTHHKTGTVLLKHIFLKEVCPTLGWKCSFDNKPYKCSSPEDARAAGLQLCFLQHGIRFKIQNTHRTHIMQVALELALLAIALVVGFRFGPRLATYTSMPQITLYLFIGALMRIAGAVSDDALNEVHTQTIRDTCARA